MVGISYNIGDLMREAFGIKGNLAIYKLPKDKNDNDTGINFNLPEGEKERGITISYKGVNQIDKITDESGRMSYMGTPILFPMTFKGGKYNTFDFNGDVVRDDYADFELPVVSLASFRRSKIVSKTKALAANGTVKETFGFTDWTIDIRGLCLSDPAQPQKLFTANDQKLMLARFEQIVDSIKVQGALFQDLNIDALVIEELSINTLKGKPGVVPFYLRCVSDEPLELVL